MTCLSIHTDRGHMTICLCWYTFGCLAIRQPVSRRRSCQRGITVPGECRPFRCKIQVWWNRVPFRDHACDCEAAEAIPPAPNEGAGPPA